LSIIITSPGAGPEAGHAKESKRNPTKKTSALYAASTVTGPVTAPKEMEMASEVENASNVEKEDISPETATKSKLFFCC
jgi:hypothetical protein